VHVYIEYVCFVFALSSKRGIIPLLTGAIEIGSIQVSAAGMRLSIGTCIILLVVFVGAKGVI